MRQRLRDLSHVPQIGSAAAAMIRQSDAFIGIWHHESSSRQNGKYGISPWMHFEYAVAMSQGKDPLLIVLSDQLDDNVWKRVNPKIAHPQYSDLTFSSKTVPWRKAYFQQHLRS